MTETPISPLAPAGGFPDLPSVEGVRFAAAKAGVKYTGRTDVMLAELARGSSLAGVFTRSATRSVPVLDCQAKLAGHFDAAAGAAIIVNSGNANAFTGGHGQASVSAVCGAVAAALKMPENRVYSASTGVIGETLPFERITEKVAELAAGLSASRIEDAARAIMTTDTFPKGSARSVTIGGRKVSIAGFAKGSGMIAPDMATMLVYIFTDAKIAVSELRDLLARLNDRTFNCITVDSDTSTSDSLMIAATGASGVDVAGKRSFSDALHAVMRDLAHQVVRDGEGATKFVEVRVTGAINDTDARRVAMAIANSPLVKTAIAGEDPNWGRIVMAVGKSGASADRDLLSIRFGDILVAERGWVSQGYTEAAGAAYMQRQEIVITTDLGLGSGRSIVWTCDLTHRYIEINADYRS